MKDSIQPEPTAEIMKFNFVFVIALETKNMHITVP